MKTVFGVSLLERSRGGQPGNKNAAGKHRRLSFQTASIVYKKDATGNVKDGVADSVRILRNKGFGTATARSKKYSNPTKSSVTRLEKVIAKGAFSKGGKISIDRSDPGHPNVLVARRTK